MARQLSRQQHWSNKPKVLGSSPSRANPNFLKKQFHHFLFEISISKQVAFTLYANISLQSAITFYHFPTDQLKKHAKKHDLDQGYNCELCGKYFMAKWALRKHLKTVHATNPKYHKCDLCDYQTMRLGNFQRHVRSKHEVRVSFSKKKQD